MIVIPNASKVVLLAIILNKDAAEELDLHVFKNNITPDVDTVLADFTEADFTGYAAIALDSANYTIAAPGAGETTPAVASYGLQDFISTADQASQSHYGYYVTRRTTGDLLWCETFGDGPYNITNDQDGFRVDPRFSLQTISA